MLVFSLPAAFLLLGWAGRLVSVAIVALYRDWHRHGAVGVLAVEIRRASRCYAKCRSSDALLSTIIVTSPGYWMLSIAYFLTGYLLLTCFIVGIEPIHDWHAVSFCPW